MTRQTLVVFAVFVLIAFELFFYVKLWNNNTQLSVNVTQCGCNNQPDAGVDAGNP